MKKLVIALIIIISALNIAVADDLESENLKGKVASVMEECRPLVLKFGTWVVSNEPYDHVWKSYRIGSSYNELGNKLETRNYNDDGTTQYYVINTYNNEGLLAESSEYSPGDSLHLKTITTYDSTGNLTERDIYDHDGKLQKHYSCKVDTKTIREWATYFNDGTLEVTTKEKLDARGNTEEEILYGADGAFKAKWTHFYDTNGQLIEDDDYYQDQNLIDWGHFYKYDEYGNVISLEQYGDDRIPYSKTIYSYKYDLYNNWVKKTESNQVTKFEKTYFEPICQTIRSITYYP